MESSHVDPRILKYIESIEQFKQDRYDTSFSTEPSDESDQLGLAIQELGTLLESRRRERQQIDSITQSINAGLLLDDVLEKVYGSFHELIPYNRIGFSLIEDGDTVRAHWAKTDQPDLQLGRDYAASLAGSSLQTIIETGRPRIIDDLVRYLEHKPTSESTRLIVEEGIRSSLTCPLIANGNPVGFMFFSSIRPYAYTDVHVDTFQKIAAQLSIIVEKGQLVSELAERQKAIEQQNETLRSLNEIKDKFLGIAAHDLRSPLSNIQLAAAMLSKSPVELDEDERKFLVGDIDRQTRYMLTLIDDLLDVSQIESGYLELHMEQFSLSQFLGDAVHRHANLAISKNMQVHLSEVPDSAICADPLRLRQVIDNLLSNAVKYSQPGSSITVWAEEKKAEWKISVQDEGPGIRPEDKERLFKYFGRLSTRPTGGEKSTGLGLAISRRIVEAHNGQIGVESEPGKGSTFWFTVSADLAKACP
ncbi:MAG: HAMP domain-containing histidine kinase [Anaerolineae bacterium]|nr:HAMP domain-containing histidine kinase [Anaerolineae bacterium]